LTIGLSGSSVAENPDTPMINGVIAAGSPSALIRSPAARTSFRAASRLSYVYVSRMPVNGFAMPSHSSRRPSVHKLSIIATTPACQPKKISRRPRSSVTFS